MHSILTHDNSPGHFPKRNRVLVFIVLTGLVPHVGQKQSDRVCYYEKVASLC